MKLFVITFLSLIALSYGGYLGRIRYPYPHHRGDYKVFPQSPDDEYAASLAGAPVGVYEKRHGTGQDVRRGLYWDGDESLGLSLGNAKVGLYGKENRQDPHPRYRG